MSQKVYKVRALARGNDGLLNKFGGRYVAESEAEAMAKAKADLEKMLGQPIPPDTELVATEMKEGA